MENMNDKKIVLRSDNPFEFHRLKDAGEKEQNLWNKPIPSYDPPRTGCCHQAYKQYYEGKNPWVEFG